MEVIYKIKFDKIKVGDFNDEEMALYKAALHYAERAVAPFSGLRVGAAILMEDGQIRGGFNIESSSFSHTICAERSAVFSTYLFYPDIKIKKLIIAVLSDKWGLFSPCGACRQIILEKEYRQKSNIEIYFPYELGVYLKVESANDLLPYPFNYWGDDAK